MTNKNKIVNTVITPHHPIINYMDAHNSITTQGTNFDIETNFTINQLLTARYTAQHLRSIVNNDTYCYKVVSFYPGRMGGVDFDLKINYLKRSKNVNQIATWINNCLKDLMPWFVEAQKEANIVGKSYLVYDVNRNVNIDNQYPLSQDVIWDSSITGITGLKIFGADTLDYTEDKKYLTRKYSGIDGLKFIKNLNENDVERWVISKSKLTQEKIDNLQYEVIHNSHVIEFTSFDYQDDTEALQISTKRHTILESPNKDTYDGISFRLIRFIKSMLRYTSFINATLNRMHRSEAIIYKKENIGEINQLLARFLSNTSDNKLKPDVSDVIKDELFTIRDSLRNFGVTLIDKKNDIEMLSRSMNGLGDLSNVFYRDIIAASYLTEYGLFGSTTGGSGLAGVDERDRAQEGQQTDELFTNHWKPLLLWIAQLLAKSTGEVSDDKHLLSIEQKPSYKLSPKDSSDWLSVKIKILIDLHKEGIIDKQVILNEISNNGLLGSHFSINESDLDRLIKGV